MKVEQYVMAYGIEQDRVRAILPEGFVSLRPVLRINAEIFQTDFLELSFTGVAVEGSCPAEKDNDGCFFLGETEILKPAEHIFREKGIL